MNLLAHQETPEEVGSGFCCFGPTEGILPEFILFRV